MVRWLLLLFITASLCGNVVSELIKLSDENFEEQFNSKDWIVKFYAPWCKHCKTLKPIFEELGSKVSHVGVGDIDATSNKVTAAKYNVSSYPTIIYKQNGHVGKYQGHRSLEGLGQFLERLNSPSVMDIYDVSELALHAIYSDNVSFVLIHEKSDSTQDRTLLTTFKNVASKLKQHATFAILPVDKGSDILHGGQPVVVKFEPGRLMVHMTNAATASEEDIHKFVEENNYPLVSKYDNHNFKRLSHIPGKYMVAAVVDYKRSETAAILAGLEHAVSPHVLTNEADMSRFIFGHLDGVRWRGFIKHHRTMVPALLVIDQASDLHQSFPLDVSSLDPTVLNAQMASIILDIVHNIDAKDRWLASEAPSIMEKISYRFKSYFPWSVLVIVLPIIFVAMSAMTPYPQEKKAKQH